MYSLDQLFLEQQTISIVMTGSLRKLGQFQGQQELLFRRKPQLLQTLKEAATIQSVESSNRIEGIEVPHERLSKILKEESQPKNRPEAEILGYRDVLAKIHKNFNQFEITPETILQIHREMLKYTTLPRGEWKIKDNLIEERLSDGQWVTRFVPIPAKDTPYYMDELCDRFHRLWQKEEIDRLFVLLAFIFDFLCIHPFTDGNGRVSRLLSVLLLHQIEIDISKYVSFEKLIEDTKESYYEILHLCSQHWHKGKHRLTPWFEYHIALIIAAYNQLNDKMSDDEIGGLQ